MCTNLSTKSKGQSCYSKCSNCWSSSPTIIQSNISVPHKLLSKLFGTAIKYMGPVDIVLIQYLASSLLTTSSLLTHYFTANNCQNHINIMGSLCYSSISTLLNISYATMGIQRLDYTISIKYTQLLVSEAFVFHAGVRMDHDLTAILPSFHLLIEL